LEIIAEKEGITKEEVQQEIGRAVSIALKALIQNATLLDRLSCEMILPPLEETHIPSR